MTNNKMTITEQELRECPFCKKEVIYHKEDGLSSGIYIAKHIECVNCKYNFSTEWSDDLIKVWNTRAYDAEMEELRKIKKKHEELKDFLFNLLQVSKQNAKEMCGGDANKFLMGGCNGYMAIEHDQLQDGFDKIEELLK